MQKLLFFGVGLVLVLSGCSDRVADDESFEERVRAACEASCKVTTTCDPSNPHYGSMDSCMEGCGSWAFLDAPSDCADAVLEDKHCRAELTCKEYMTWQHGEYEERLEVCKETDQAWRTACAGGE